MRDPKQMGERKRHVLAAVVRDYIRTAEPVGSKRVVEKHRLRVSSATVRNDMAALEDYGLLRQPHTSAGRVPSDTGYRFFVDELMEIPRLSPTAERLLRAARRYRADIDAILREICAILSKVTQHTSIALVPGLQESEVKHLQLSKVDGRRVLLIIVSDAGHVIHELIDAGESYTAQEIDAMSGILQRRLVGMRVADMEALDTKHLRAELRLRGLLFEEALRVVREHLSRQQYYVYLDGTMHIVREPEFSDIERLTRVLGALEHEQTLADVLSQCAKGDGVRARIGEEHDVEAISDLSLVAATYGRGSVRGAVGVLGPTRMDYERAHVAVEYAAGIVDRALDP